MTTAEIISILLKRKSEAEEQGCNAIDDDSQYYMSAGYMNAIDETVELMTQDRPVLDGQFIVLDDNGIYGLLMNRLKNPVRFIVAYRVNYEDHTWAHGTYFNSLDKAIKDYRKKTNLMEEDDE